MIKKVNIPGLRYANFKIVLPPLEDELFSSWIVRMAYAHWTHPHSFTNQYLGYRYNSFFRRDPDVSMVPQAVKKLGRMCRGKVDVYSLTLKTYAGYLQEEITDIPNLFLCPLRFCPACLRQDKVPYFRKKWRVMFYTVCQEHECYMQDGCPKCGEKLNISKMYRDDKPYTYCHRCGFELLRAKALRVPKKYRYGLERQREIMKTIDRGYVQLVDRRVYSFHFFEVFVKIAKLILVQKKTKYIDRHPLFGLLHRVNDRQYASRLPVYRQLAVQEQFALFTIIYDLLRNPSKELAHFMEENELTVPFMLKDMNHRPFWYADFVTTR